MSFVTKDSGERQTFSTGMVRDSAAKELRPDLLPVAMLRRMAEGEIFKAFLDWFEDDNRQGGAAWLLECISEEEKKRGGAPMLVRWAELMGRGAIKYGERNWEKARTPEELERFKASAFRHFVQWFYGLNKEEDHAAGVFFNVAGAEYVKERLSDFTYTITFSCEPFAVEKLVESIKTEVKTALDEIDVEKLEEAAAKITPAWEPTVGDRVRASSNPEGPRFLGTLKKIDDSVQWPYLVAFDDGSPDGVYTREEIELASGAT